MKLPRLLLATALLAAGCADPAGPSAPPASFAADDVVLQVRVTGGFVPPQTLVTEIPVLTVYGDGRAITTGPIPAIYPGPALPNVQVQRIGADGVAKLTDLALDAGVGQEQDFGMPPVADAPSTEFTVRTAAGLQRTTVDALGAGGTETLTGAQREAREKMQRLVDALTDLSGTLKTTDRPQPYEPAVLAAVSSPFVETSDPVLKDPPAVAWPGPALPGATVGDLPDVHCLTSEAGQTAAILAAAKAANARTPWTSGGTSWSVAFRPLLPHESSCADLG
ncbi:hypothetical protein KZZ52_05535 [Dactylosporangium sp. AC04546]|uniref:hypothetical protein n=1 Tax=Dactylosporangium sp. AC04546 TaxID=2862460 RepID=UPI001EDF539A|nr:hypothetical protein [Dactylosporangium sp. AC04546]WVK84869.1 hypothetical protein KZZ52_05535 [Dactylosporangium sp. AC04546]